VVTACSRHRNSLFNSTPRVLKPPPACCQSGRAYLEHVVSDLVSAAGADARLRMAEGSPLKIDVAVGDDNDC